MRDELQPTEGVNVAAWASPFKSATASFRVWQGLTLFEIADLAELPAHRRPFMRCKISRGAQSSDVAFADWPKIRPRDGATVEFYVQLHGKALSTVLMVVVAVAAPLLAGAALAGLGIAATALTTGIATFAISAIGQLLVTALIPPPSQKGSAADNPNFTITGVGNAYNPYGIYPTVLGRHLMFPPLTARGYSETIDDEIYWRSRFTFGYGPVSLETLKIGTTDILSFAGIELEFLNVDQTLTEANIPALVGNPAVSWKTGTTPMALYPSDILEDGYSVLLAYNVATSRNTRANAVKAQVDIGFQGLCTFDSDGNKNSRTVNVSVEYRAAGSGGGYTLAATKACYGRTTAYVRFTQEIVFPAPNTYEIRVTRTTAAAGSSQTRDLASLASIRTIKTGGVPSNANIAELAIKIKATEQLNGQVDTLNAIVQQLAPIWTGSAWTAPQPVRHPAWIFARALMGPMINQPVAASRLALTSIKAWADAEPGWTCDAVIDQPTPLASVLDLICATGRARRCMEDLKFSVIRDGGAGPIVQHFTPRNSFNFRGSRTISRQLHALRVQVLSEAKEWQQDEILVYADGYTSANATIIETLNLTGVVIPAADATQGNPWKLGRYTLAQAILRPEEFSFQSDLDHVRCQMGDKIRVVHDVALFGVGSARLKSWTTSGANIATLTLDDLNNLTDGATYRVRIRYMDGSAVGISTTYSAATGVFTVTGTPSAAGLEGGELCQIELTGATPVDMLVKSIHHDGDLMATLTCVPAAPECLMADSGTIPDYSPNITALARFGPDKPDVIAARTGTDVAIVSGSGAVLPRIGVDVGPRPTKGPVAVELQTRWRETGTTTWKSGRTRPHTGTVYTDDLVDGVSYDVDIRSISKDGKSRGWKTAATGFAALAHTDTLAAPTGWAATPFIDTISFEGPKAFYYNFLEYRLYASVAGVSTETLVARSASPRILYAPPAGAAWTRYKIAVALNTGEESPHTAYIAAVVTGVGSSSIGAGAVTNANLATVPTATFKARLTAGTGSPEDLTAAQATSLLSAATTTTKGLVPAPGTATGKFLKDDLTWANPVTVTLFSDSAFTLQDDVDPTKQAQFQLSSITTGTTRVYTLPNSSGTICAAEVTTVVSGQWSFNHPTLSFGNGTASCVTGLAVGPTLSGNTKAVNVGTGGVAGSTTNITIGSATGTCTTTILGTVVLPNSSITLGKLANIAVATILGNNTAGAAAPIALTAAQVKTLLAISLATDVTGTLPVSLGGTGGTTTLLASGALRGYTTTATAGGTTTLTGASTDLQFFTGTLAQTVALPTAANVLPGGGFLIVNASTGTLTVNSNSGVLVVTIYPGQIYQLICNASAGGGASNYTPIVISSDLTPCNVSQLPSASGVGAGVEGFALDALTPTFGATVTGGGAVKMKVFSNGANWIVG